MRALALTVLLLGVSGGTAWSDVVGAQALANEEGVAQRFLTPRQQRNERVLSQEELEAAMRPHVPAIQRCYKTHTAKQKGATGSLQIEMLIRPKGLVQKLWVRAKGVRGKKLARCIHDLAISWRFPEKSGFTNAIVPFRFLKSKAKGSGPLPSCWSAQGCTDKKRPAKPPKG